VITSLGFVAYSPYAAHASFGQKDCLNHDCTGAVTFFVV